MMRSILAAMLAVTSLAQAAPKPSPLATKLPDVRLDDAALDDTLYFIADAAGLNLIIDRAALLAAGVELEQPISLRLGTTTVGRLLKQTLKLVGTDRIGAYLEGNVLTVTSRAKLDADLVTRTYDVRDLLLNIPDFEPADLRLGLFGGNGSNQGGGGENNGRLNDRAAREQLLIDLITSTIRPDIWQQNGGTSSIRILQGQLVITAPRDVVDPLAW